MADDNQKLVHESDEEFHLEPAPAKSREVAPSALRSGVGWTVAVVSAFLVLQLPGLTRLPAFGGDEVQYAEPAFNLITTGRLALPMWGSSRNFEDAFFVNVPGYPLVLSGVYAVCGLGFWQTRLPALVSGILCIVLVMQFARMAGCNWRTAAVGAGLLAIAPHFVQASRDGRPDTTAIFLALGCLGVVLSRCSGRTHACSQPFLAGLLIGLGVMMHPNVVPVALGCLILLYRHDPTGRRRETIILFLIGAGLPFLPWVVAAICNRQAFLEQFIPWSKMNSVLGQNPLTALRDEIVERYGRGYVRGPSWLFLIALSVPLAFSRLLRTNQVGRGCAVVWLVQFGCFAFGRTKEETWLVYTEPYIVVIAATLLHELGCRRPLIGTLKWLRVGILTAVILVFVNGLALMAVRYWVMDAQWEARDYGMVENKLAALIPPHARVLGQQSVWLVARRHVWRLRVLTQGGWVGDIIDSQWDEAAVCRFDWAILSPDSQRPSLNPMWAAVQKHFDLVAKINNPSNDVKHSVLSTREPYQFLVYRHRESG